MILLIFGRKIPEKICKKKHIYSPAHVILYDGTVLLKLATIFVAFHSLSNFKSHQHSRQTNVKQHKQ